MTALVHSYSDDAQETAKLRLAAYNPATGQQVGEVVGTPLNALPDVIARARAAQPAWEQAGLPHRLAIIRKFKEVFYLNRDRVVELARAEVGKSDSDGFATEFWFCIEMISYYLRTAQRTLAPVHKFAYQIPFRHFVVERRAHGVVLIITPWNYPFTLPMAPLIAALLAGNTVVFKPSEYTKLSGDLIARLLWEAGVPRDVLQVVQGDGAIAAGLIQQRPNKICFTGGVHTGRKVATAAAELLIPVTLELGGKDAALILEDADLNRAATALTWASMLNAGQICGAVKRIFVMRPVLEPFVKVLTDSIRAHIRIGVHDEATMGPIMLSGQLTVVKEQVADALTKGATVAIGGHEAHVPESGGMFYEPTILLNVTPDMRVAYEETFGPVVAISAIDSDEEGIQRANETSYGLTASVWTRNAQRGLRIARKIRTGYVGINDHLLAASHPTLPWGGVGDTGYGRTRSEAGLLDMTTEQALSYDWLPTTLVESLVYPPVTPVKQQILRRFVDLTHGVSLRDRLRALLP
jgi:succinate-semialdehyde dehydrogenase/glutarate-semialdehyde dehydrogenase